ncbi:MAG: L-2-hydroxyglutarate oxidase [Candidatus Omnitrophica bacterium]|nr:L-2-hydroxyglutarate oxidase [Candidatus Omnitrophota bacterium]
MSQNKFDYVIIGAGIVGLSIARYLNQNFPQATICILEKEGDVGAHSSGRNSGVLHGGFYYTANSLKAKFTVEGNKTMKSYCRAKGIPFNDCGKLVVAMDEGELEQLYELERRGNRNGSNVKMIDVAQARDMEPAVQTFKKALYSPDTASLNPQDVLFALKDDLLKAGVQFKFSTAYRGHQGNVVKTIQGDFESKKIINCAGLYADKVAHDFDFGKKYTMIPFKGLYLKYAKNKTDVRMNIYPVPNLKNPFLGVHYTKTVDGTIKIGPTAIPAFWRENYSFREHFSFEEFAEIAYQEAKLFTTNAFGFRDLAFEEIHKYDRNYFINLATKMVPVDPQGFGEFTRPGIRAQLLDKTRLELVQDFVVEADKDSIHVLNAVSPAFTCAFPFAEFVCREYVLKT